MHPNAKTEQLGAEMTAARGSIGEGTTDEKPEPPARGASLREIYQFTSGTERAFLCLAALAALAAGAVMPMTLFAFESMLDQLGAVQTQPGAQISRDVMRDMLLTFIYLGAGILVANFTYYSIVEHIAQNQVSE